MLLPWCLYIGIGLSFSVAKTSQISFKIKIKINIQRYLERYKLFDKYSWLIIYDINKLINYLKISDKLSRNNICINFLNNPFSFL